MRSGSLLLIVLTLSVPAIGPLQVAHAQTRLDVSETLVADTSETLVFAGDAFQQTDPDFRPSVARPAYPRQHPKVSFDEAHNNSETSGGGLPAVC